MHGEEFLKETRHAAESLIVLIGEERKKIEQAFEAVGARYSLAPGRLILRWEAPSDATPEQKQQMHKVLHDCGVSLGQKMFSTAAICGALLQIAKQGISIVHGSITACPKGR